MSDDTLFSYDIRSRKGLRNLSISIRRDGSVTVSKPHFLPNYLVAPFIKKHTSWIEKKLEELKKRPPSILSKHSVPEYKAHKEEARAIVHKKLAEFNAKYKFEYGGVRIGNQRSRWGSCSAQKNLNFNYKIVFLPDDLQNYLIVHELCHLKELNHSEKFWALVGRELPNWKALRSRLKKV